MEPIFAALSETELDLLDQFLMERTSDATNTEGKDEGVLDVSELDGFLTAIVSGPVLIPPSRWLPAVWGDFEPTWGSPKVFESIFTLIMRHMNAIADSLMEHPQDFEPLFLVREEDGKTNIIADEWCHGYMRGVALAAESWHEGGQEMHILLTPIVAFGTEEGWQSLQKMNMTAVENVRNAITPNVQEIHAWWLARRDEEVVDHSPLRQAEPRIGRNDPCPCGSGKKYKKCCLQ